MSVSDDVQNGISDFVRCPLHFEFPSYTSGHSNYVNTNMVENGSEHAHGVYQISIQFFLIKAHCSPIRDCAYMQPSLLQLHDTQ